MSSWVEQSLFAVVSLAYDLPLIDSHCAHGDLAYVKSQPGLLDGQAHKGLMLRSNLVFPVLASVSHGD
jgi:hypothetical protein